MSYKHAFRREWKPFPSPSHMYILEGLSYMGKASLLGKSGSQTGMTGLNF